LETSEGNFRMTFLKSKCLIIGGLILSAHLPMATVSGADSAPKQGSSAEQANVTDKDLRAFAKAYVEYHNIRQNYEPRLKGTKDEKEKLQREGDNKVKQVLEKQGLTPQSYNRLFVAVNNNQQLRQKALVLISEERKKS
jgi:hypothetical protein